MINDALKGHLMKRGTLMILKRLLTTALGALGLSALAAGSAFAQTAGGGNIPAPDIFDDQITCSMFVPITTGMNAAVPMPTKVPTGGTTSPLDDAIGMGTATVTDSATLGLGYVIPTAGANCGAGATGPMFGAMNIDAGDGMGGGADGDFLDAGDTYMAGSIPMDVADGYTALLAKFTVVYGDPLVAPDPNTDVATSSGTDGVLKAAQKALNDAIAAGSTGTTLDPYNKAVTDAQAAHTKALATLNAADRGPIYQAGVAEWQAQSAVTNAIAAYNDQVGKVNTALTALDGLSYRTMQKDADGDGNPDAGTGVSKYVPLGNPELFVVGSSGDYAVYIDAMGMARPNLSHLIDYTNSDLSDPQVGMAAVAGSADDADGENSDTNDSNFTAAGKLIVPQVNWDHDGDSTTPTQLRNVTDPNNRLGPDPNNASTSNIRTTVENTRIATAALKKARDENTNPSTQAIYDEAYRRAKLEQDYYDTLWQEVLSSTDDLRTIDQQNATGNNAVAAYSISSRSSKYVNENNKRFTNEQTLRTAVADRMKATEATAAAFTSPQSFYEQLVARREALKTTADNAVTDAQKDGGTASKALLDEQKAKEDALKAARDAKSTFDNLYADANDPKVGLINTLVKNDGDDGQALADAISSNYTSAAEAKTAADAAKTAADAAQTKADAAQTKADKVADSVAGLTGDDGSVGQNTASITKNTADIKENRDDINQINSDLYGTTSSQHTSADACAGGLLNKVDCNVRTIDDVKSDLEDLDKDLYGGDGDVGDIKRLDTAIGKNAGNIVKNADAIGKNAGNIVKNADAIGKNAGNIVKNADAIGKNADDILTNAGHIATNVDNIAANAGNISTNAGNIANNAMAIESNDADIAVNVDNIAANAGNIVVNAGNIATNATNIEANMGSIATNAGNIATNASGIADNMAAIGANQGAIAANANSIGANASAIGRNASMIGELSEDLDVVRAGVAASMALAGMPAINGRGISIGVGSYDGESAFAVGFQIQGEQASFKIGVTSSGGETGASAGVGFNF